MKNGHFAALVAALAAVYLFQGGQSCTVKRVQAIMTKGINVIDGAHDVYSAVTTLNASNDTVVMTSLNNSYFGMRKVVGTLGLWDFEEGKNLDLDAEPGTCGIMPHLGNEIIKVAQSHSVVPNGQFPWQVRLEMREPSARGVMKMRVCGGVLLSDRSILTSASCVSDFAPGNIAAVMGKSNMDKDEAGEQYVGIEQVIKHPKFSVGSSFFDVAIVQTDEPVAITRAVIPVCLPERCTSDAEYTAMTCVSHGWNTQFDAPSSSANGKGTLLQFAYSVIMPKDECSAVIATQNRYNEKISTRQQHFVCAENQKPSRKACQADNGGPLVCRAESSESFFLEGILAFHTDCATPADSTSTYVRICRVLKWIKEVAEL